MINIDKNFYTILVTSALEEEDIPGLSDEKAVELIRESIDETVKYYDDTFDFEDIDWEVFESDMIADAKKKLGVQ